MDGPPLDSLRMSGETPARVGGPRAGLRCERIAEPSDSLARDLHDHLVSLGPHGGMQSWKNQEDYVTSRVRGVSAELDPLARVFTPKERSEREKECDDDDVSVSTDASCLTDLSLETASAEETCLFVAFPVA